MAGFLLDRKSCLKAGWGEGVCDVTRQSTVKRGTVGVEGGLGLRGQAQCRPRL